MKKGERADVLRLAKLEVEKRVSVLANASYYNPVVPVGTVSKLEAEIIKFVEPKIKAILKANPDATCNFGTNSVHIRFGRSNKSTKQYETQISAVRATLADLERDLILLDGTVKEAFEAFMVTLTKIGGTK